MSSINGITPTGLYAGIFSQGMKTSADSGNMDPIKGTNTALAMARIAIEAQGTAGEIEMAKANLVLDAMKDGGAQIVQLLENLGQSVDLYA